MAKHKASKLSIASCILGFLSLACGFILMPLTSHTESLTKFMPASFLLGIALAIMGFLFGIISIFIVIKNKRKSNLGVVMLVLGILSSGFALAFYGLLLKAILSFQ